jgi:hypothetical protein
MRYLFHNCGNEQPDGTIVIPAAYVVNLRKQMSTIYGDLTEREKEYDRQEVLPLMGDISDYMKNKVSELFEQIVRQN